jgi:crotonobetainyl-CoA:carnitine CoA-transferase CaiB-like acyl-CoA transferase
MTAPLDGVLVADFSRVLAGPLATMTLADLGATVVKVERRGSGDDTRSWGPPWTGLGEHADLIRAWLAGATPASLSHPSAGLPADSLSADPEESTA